MSIVTMALYNPLAPVGVPKAFRNFLPCRMSRIAIMSVRITLSAMEIEKYEMSRLKMGIAFSLVNGIVRK